MPPYSVIVFTPLALPKKSRSEKGRKKSNRAVETDGQKQKETLVENDRDIQHCGEPSSFAFFLPLSLQNG